MKVRMLAVLAGMVASAGCATIMAGGPDRVSVSANVPGATVSLDGQVVGQAPMTVTLDREKSNGLIRIDAPGYNPVVIQRTKHIQGWFWANICLGGVVGIVVDLVTGDIKAFDDAAVNVALVPATAPPPAPAAPPPVAMVP